MQWQSDRQHHLASSYGPVSFGIFDWRSATREKQQLKFFCHFTPSARWLCWKFWFRIRIFRLFWSHTARERSLSILMSSRITRCPWCSMEMAVDSTPSRWDFSWMFQFQVWFFFFCKWGKFFFSLWRQWFFFFWLTRMKRNGRENWENRGMNLKFSQPFREICFFLRDCKKFWGKIHKKFSFFGAKKNLKSFKILGVKRMHKKYNFFGHKNWSFKDQKIQNVWKNVKNCTKKLIFLT